MSELDSEISDEMFLEELKKEFTEKCVNNMNTLQELLKVKNFKQISEIAHDIKGTAGLFDYDEASEIADKLVIAARAKNEPEVTKYFNDLNQYMKKNKII